MAALRLAQEALARDPGNGHLLALAGRSAMASGNAAAAETWLESALGAGNDDPRTHADLAALLCASGRTLQAEALLRPAAERYSHEAGLSSQLGVLLLEEGRGDDAELWFRRALATDPGLGQAVFNLALLLARRGSYDEAEGLFRKALKLMPRQSTVPYNLAALLARTGRLEQAEGLYRKAIQLAPADPSAHYSFAVLQKLLGREDRAEQSYRRALALRPDFAQAALDLALLLLRQGRYREGWPLFESRYAPTLPHRGASAPALSCPQWRGENLQGRSILVICDQGFGDQIQFCRFLEPLKDRGADCVTLVAPAALSHFLGTAGGIDRVLLDLDPRIHTEHYDYWTFLLSLPFRLALDPPYLARTPYLEVSPERAPMWAKRMPLGAGFHVGVVWRGSELHVNDAERSLPHLSTLAPLWDVPGVCFWSLQMGSASSEALEPIAGEPLRHVGNDIVDFRDTAAAVNALDLIVSVDTAVAHVAGALDKAAWVLLPRHDTDWRWGRDGETNPWYRSLRLFRQKVRGDWAEVVSELRSALLQTVQLRGR